jgi:hypothetical protein
VGVDAQGRESVVDEFLFSFTHNTVMDWMLPGIQPTGKKGECSISTSNCLCVLLLKVCTVLYGAMLGCAALYCVVLHHTIPCAALPWTAAVSVPFIVVIKFEGDKLKAERIYWDQVGVLARKPSCSHNLRHACKARTSGMYSQSVCMHHTVLASTARLLGMTLKGANQRRAHTCQLSCSCSLNTALISEMSLIS